MEFPIYTPWENLDAQTIQKVINSGINYRTYCDEKPWDVSFEIDFLPKEELIIVVLIEHGRRKGGVSVQKTSERTEISPYSKEEQAEMLKAYNEKIDRYETWNALFTGPTEIMCMNHTWITCIPGNTGVTEYFCQIIMKNNYIRCSQIPMLL